MTEPLDLAPIRVRDAEITYELQGHGLYWERHALLAEIDRLTAERDLFRDRLDGQAWADLEAERDRLAGELAAEEEAAVQMVRAAVVERDALTADLAAEREKVRRVEAWMRQTERIHGDRVGDPSAGIMITLEGLSAALAGEGAADQPKPEADTECDHEWHKFRTLNGSTTKCLRCGKRASL